MKGHFSFFWPFWRLVLVKRLYIGEKPKKQSFLTLPNVTFRLTSYLTYPYVWKPCFKKLFETRWIRILILVLKAAVSSILVRKSCTFIRRWISSFMFFASSTIVLTQTLNSSVCVLGSPSKFVFEKFFFKMVYVMV